MANEDGIINPMEGSLVFETEEVTATYEVEVSASEEMQMLSSPSDELDRPNTFNF